MNLVRKGKQSSIMLLIIAALILVSVAILGQGVYARTRRESSNYSAQTKSNNEPLCENTVPLKVNALKDLATRQLRNPAWDRHPVTLVNDKYLVLSNVCVADEGVRGLKLRVESVNSMSRLFSEQWGPSGRRNYSVYVDALDTSKEADWLDYTVAYVSTPLKWSMKNIYHSFDDLYDVPRLLNLARNLSNGMKSVPMLAHYSQRWNRTAYFQIIDSMSGRSPLYYKTDKEVCLRRLVMKTQVKPQTLRTIFAGLEEKAIAHIPSSRTVWCDAMNTNCQLPKKTTVTIIQRLRNRKILNLDFVVKALRKRGWAVNIVNFECMTISNQFVAIQNSTTLIGTHGAGLSWARWLHRDAAEIQLIGFPCAFESHSRMNYVKRYSIEHADIHAIGSEVNQTRADHLCEIRGKPDRLLSESDKELKAATNYDIRRYDTVIDIPALVGTIEKLDPRIAR